MCGGGVGVLFFVGRGGGAYTSAAQRTQFLQYSFKFAKGIVCSSVVVVVPVVVVAVVIVFFIVHS